MVGIIGTKVGMTSIIDANGNKIGCTVVQAGPCVISQVKTTENDGYSAIQLSYGDLKPKHTNKAETGHFAKANTVSKAISVEFRTEGEAGNHGESVDVTIFAEGDFVDVVGTSKGKGFQGVVKRHGFNGVGPSTHGQHDRARAPGSIGASSYPSKVFKGVRMAGRMGGKRVKATNIEVLKVMAEQNVIVLKGSFAGHNGSYVIIEK